MAPLRTVTSIIYRPRYNGQRATRTAVFSSGHTRRADRAHYAALADETALPCTQCKAEES